MFIENIREVTRGFKSFEFANGHSLEYRAGQFITLVDKTHSGEIRRSYSIISSPVLNEPLTIAVKRIDNGHFSRKLTDHANIGDRLLTTGSAGFFCLPDNLTSYTSIFFFAAGSGISPVLSLIKTTIHLNPGTFIYLIYSNRSVGSTAFYPELTQLAEQFPRRLHIDFLYSSGSVLRKARLNADLLQEILNSNPFDHTKTLFYLCGPESYMRMIVFHLLEEGFSLEKIKKEDFNPGNKKITVPRPLDKTSHFVKLVLYRNEYEFLVQYPDSILQAAKKIKVDLPYSCETGKCGSCAALCISGEVWLSNNEVLSEKDLARGLTLTCTGHPQKTDVVLKIE